MNTKEIFPNWLNLGLRNQWYAFQRLGFYRHYYAGLKFDLFQKDYVVNGLTFKIPKDLTTRIHRARFYNDTHELEERILAEKYIPKNAKVLELGGCLGVVSALINKRLDDAKAHVVVEANPALIPVLTENRDINGCEFSIASGMVSKTSDGKFYLDDCIVVSGPVQESERHIVVPVFSIEDLVEQYGFSFDTLFMDIQGGERDLLLEHKDALVEFKLVILEMHPHLVGEEAVRECRQALKESGLECIEVMGLIEVWSREDVVTV